MPAIKKGRPNKPGKRSFYLRNSVITKLGINEENLHNTDIINERLEIACSLYEMMIAANLSVPKVKQLINA